MKTHIKFMPSDNLKITENLIGPISLEDRVLDMISTFTNAIKFSELMNGLNINNDYESVTKQELKKTLEKMMMKRMVRRFGNTSSYIDIRDHHNGRYGRDR